MAEPDPPAPSRAIPPDLERCEWLPADAGAALLRAGGTQAPGQSATGTPALWLGGDGLEPVRIEPLRASAAAPGRWRALFLVEREVLRAGLRARLIWPDGRELPLPSPDALEAAPEAAEAPAEPEPAGQVIDHAVLAERRARRAEAAGRAEARAAAEARQIVAALESRLEDLARERDDLDARLRAATDAAGGPVPLSTRPVAPAHGDTAGDGVDLVAALALARAEQQRAAAHSVEREAVLSRTQTALARLKRQLADLRLRLRSQSAAHAADSVRLAVVERELADARPREAAAHEEIAQLRAEVADAVGARRRQDAEIARLRAERARVDDERRELAAELESERHRADGAERAVAELRVALDAARAAESAASARAETAERATSAAFAEAHEHAERVGRALAEARAERAQIMSDLRASRCAEQSARSDAMAVSLERASLKRELDARDGRLSELESRLSEGEIHRESLRAQLAAERESRREQAERLAELERRSEVLAADLEAARRRLEAAVGEQEESERLRARVRSLEEELAAARRVVAEPADEPAPQAPEQSPATTAEQRSPVTTGQSSVAAERKPPLHERIAALERRPAAATDLAELAGLLGEHGPARAPQLDEGDTSLLASRLDRAAAFLRAATPVEPEDSQAPADAGAPSGHDAGEHAASPSPSPAPGHIVGAMARVPIAAEQAVERRPARALARNAGREGLARRVERAAPLRGAVVGLAREDPFAAARLLAGLLPAQGAFLDTDIDYDLTIRELGTFAVTVAARETSVRVLRRPRSRHAAELHLSAGSLAIAELLTGHPHRVGRFLAPVRLRGPKRRLATLGAIVEAQPTLADIARAGARLEPGLVLRALPHAIDPAWCTGHEFTVLKEIVEEIPQRWLLACGPDGLSARPVAAGTPADASVNLSRSCFDRIVRGEAPVRGDLPTLKGDLHAIELLRGWIERARA